MSTKKSTASKAPKSAKSKPAKKTKDSSVAVAAPAKKAKANKGDEKLSALDAAAKVLGESAEALNTKQMVDAMAAKGYWTSPGGKTPHATLYSAILREIKTKGSEARFKKTDRGHFTSK